MNFNFKKIVPVCIGIFFSSLFMGQSPAIEWQKSLGGAGVDEAKSIIQTSDDGYMIAGTSNSINGDVGGNHGQLDYWIAKLNSTGSIQWQKSLGGSSFDRANCIIQTNDGGYVVVGGSESNNGNVAGNHGYSDCWIVKLNSDGGVIEWQKSLGGTWNDWANSVIQTSDGGYVIAGATSSNNGDVTVNKGYIDYWLIKLDSGGNLLWQRTLGGAGEDVATSVLQTNDGGLVVSGYSESNNNGDVTGNHGLKDFWIVKLNEDAGVIHWKKSFGGSHVELAHSIKQTSDGGYIVAGHAYSNNGDITGNHGETDCWVVKLNSSGNIQWQKSLGGTYVDSAYSIVQTVDGGYVVTGGSSSVNGDVIGLHLPATTGYGGAPNYDFWAVKLSAIGDILWQKCLGGSGSDVAYSIIWTNDGGYAIAGMSNSNNGDVSGNHGDNDYWVVKLAPDNLLATNEISKNIAINVYPNPVKETIILKVDYFTPLMEVVVTDLNGRVLHNQKLEGMTTKINTSMLEKGVYWLNITGGIQKITKKLIKE